MPYYLDTTGERIMQTSGAWGQKVSLAAEPTALKTYKLKRLEPTALGSVE